MWFTCFAALADSSGLSGACKGAPACVSGSVSRFLTPVEPPIQILLWFPSKSQRSGFILWFHLFRRDIVISAFFIQTKKGTLPINPCIFKFQTSICLFSELREPFLTIRGAKWPHWGVLSEGFEQKTKFWIFGLPFWKNRFFRTILPRRQIKNLARRWSIRRPYVPHISLSTVSGIYCL